MSENKMSRGKAIKTMLAGGMALGASTAYARSQKRYDVETIKNYKIKGNVNHSACRWCYSKIELEKLVIACKEMGLKAIDLLNPPEWEVATKHGLEVSMSFGSSLGITKGFNDPQYHEQLQKEFKELIPKAADAGLKRIICFSGNRNGMSDEKGMENCAVGLEPVVKLAKKHGITLIMELLNSKVNHPDYMCDLTSWGVGLTEKLGSDHFRLLYDIYHMQIMEGDVIATIKKYHKYFDHYHTGGVPGRHEINESQELYYPAIIRAILDTGYTGYVAQEFIPVHEDPLVSLKEAVMICDV
ncbi:MAG: TIM barrel protein [Bacteroidota bacterium]